jgi:molybdopterin/thiamine biosynthesis adenylyltransferase
VIPRGTDIPNFKYISDKEQIFHTTNMSNISVLSIFRLRAARVLLIGVRGLGAEVAKNIVLAGVKSLTLLDHTNVSYSCCT